MSTCRDSHEETERNRERQRQRQRPDDIGFQVFAGARTHLVGALAERNQIGKQAVHERHRLEAERHAVSALIERALEREEIGVGAGRAELRREAAEGQRAAGGRMQSGRMQRAEGREQSIICGT
jgi:hypothetical protein